LKRASSGGSEGPENVAKALIEARRRGLREENGGYERLLQEKALIEKLVRRKKAPARTNDCSGKKVSRVLKKIKRKLRNKLETQKGVSRT